MKTLSPPTCQQGLQRKHVVQHHIRHLGVEPPHKRPSFAIALVGEHQAGHDAKLELIVVAIGVNVAKLPSLVDSKITQTNSWSTSPVH